MNGIQYIEAERNRQIYQKHFDAEHDDEYTNKELVSSAAQLMTHYSTDGIIGIKQFGSCDNWHIIEKHGEDEIRLLSIAGALVAAEIDRLLRKGTQTIT